MQADRQGLEVDQNFDAFQRIVGELLTEHRDRYALMRDAKIVEFFDTPGDAYREGMCRFDDEIFSIQEVTDQPIDLGFFSHVAN